MVRTANARVLFLADTHLGFDLPPRPRVERRRRGPDFFRSFETALEPALRGEVDLVVHGGDLLYRSKVPPTLVQRALAPLLRVADRGVPVVIVPGNHERSRIPFPILAAHPMLHVIDRPQTLRLEVGGMSVAVSGFPYQPDGVRRIFPDLVEATSYRAVEADARLLCVHHAFEGATVGEHDYTFRNADDVVRMADLPWGFAAVLSGHIHRHQVLRTDRFGRRLPCPVLYPGSTERTSFVERNETKGYLMLYLEGSVTGGRLRHWDFRSLPARPMLQVEVEAEGLTASQLERRVRSAVQSAPADAVMKLRVHGTPRDAAVLRAARLRTWTPATMNLSVAWVDARQGRRSPPSVGTTAGVGRVARQQRGRVEPAAAAFGLAGVAVAAADGSDGRGAQLVEQRLRRAYA